MASLFTPIQIILILLACTVIAYDFINIQIFAKTGSTVLVALATGLILGDPKTGLLIGGTMELMGLGIAGFGGASVPNYRIGAVVGTAYAIATGGGLEVALIVGIPTSTLGVQFDVLAKMAGSLWLHMAQKAAADGNYKKCYSIIFWTNLLFSRITMTLTYPVAIFLLLGQTMVEGLLAMIPTWFTGSLTTVGNILPALGMAILLKYLPVRRNVHYLILGFVLSVYMGLDILPIALIGTVIAMAIYYDLQKRPVMMAGGNSDQGEVIGDE